MQQQSARTYAVFFDFDGVLLDSLDEHLNFCRDYAAKHSVAGVDIPGKEDFKRKVRAGMKISPMKEFFLAVGYPEPDANSAVDDYSKNFQAIRLFEGIKDVLRRLEPHVHLGIVTSNVRKNVEQPLGDCVKLFNPNCIFTDDGSPKLGKAAALREGALQLGLRPDRIIFVGDQMKDFEAATEAGVAFLGVSYGWCFPDDEKEVTIVRHPAEIAGFVLSRIAETPKQVEKRWERCKEAAGREKEWMNLRLGWLFTPQAFLFTAFGVALTKIDDPATRQIAGYLQAVLPVVGMFLCGLVGGSVVAAAVMHRKWFTELEGIVEKHPELNFTFGSGPRWTAWVARWLPVGIPVIFFLAWFVLFIEGRSVWEPVLQKLLGY